MNGKRLAHRQFGDRIKRDRAHQRPVRAHPLAVKGRQHESPFVQVRFTVEEQYRTLAHESAEGTIRFARMKMLGIALKDFADSGRVAGEDERRDSGNANGEPVAVPAAAFVEEAKRGANETERRDEPRARPKRRRGVSRPEHHSEVPCDFGGNNRASNRQPTSCVLSELLVNATERLHMTTSSDRIEKKVLLHAPRERVWRAISDARQFGSWFGVKLDGPFVAGGRVTGKIAPTTVDAEVAKMQKPYEGFAFEITVDRVEPMRHFSFRWHPGGLDPGVDYSKEPTTLVAFELE